MLLLFDELLFLYDHYFLMMILTSGLEFRWGLEQSHQAGEERRPSFREVKLRNGPDNECLMGVKLEDLWNNNPKSTLLDNNTQALITTKQAQASCFCCTVSYQWNWQIYETKSPNQPIGGGGVKLEHLFHKKSPNWTLLACKTRRFIKKKKKKKKKRSGDDVIYYFSQKKWLLASHMITIIYSNEK